MEEEQGATIPPQPPRHSASKRRGSHNQTMAATVASNSSSRVTGQEAVKMMESAKRLGAQEFQGTTDLAQDEAWLRRMERVFELMQCAEEQKLRIATYMFKGRALEWWNSIHNRHGQEQD